jgi:glucosamine--fructose-6-phosphate aminotransferase (isomerizing)
LAEIFGQPDALRRASDAIAEQRSTLQTLANGAARPGLALFTGMGSSYDACYPAVNVLAGRGVAAGHLDAAELVHFRSPALATASVLVVVSQSGESAEVVRLVDSLTHRHDRPLLLSITNGLDNPLARGADLRLDTHAGVETGPSTMTFAASIAQLAVVALTLAGDAPDAAIERVLDSSEAAATAIERILDRAEWTADLLASVTRGSNVVAVLGRGPSRAAAEMGALTLKESGVMAESFATGAFRHGPFELATPGMAAIVLATEPETRTLDLGLAADLVEAGASVAVMVTDGRPLDGARTLSLPPIDRLVGSTVSIVPIQLLAWRLAGQLGREPGAYLRASKVTTHE